MLKGISRRVIVVSSPDPQMFEQAIFIVRNEAVEGANSQQLVREACRVVKSYTKGHSLRKRDMLPPWVWSVAGAAAVGALWLLLSIL